MKHLLPILFGTILCSSAPLTARAAEIVTVKLAGGAQLTATLLQKTDDRVVLDLGHEVVTVDAKRVLSIESPEQATKGQTSRARFLHAGSLG